MPHIAVIRREEHPDFLSADRAGNQDALRSARTWTRIEAHSLREIITHRHRLRIGQDFSGGHRAPTLPQISAHTPTPIVARI